LSGEEVFGDFCCQRFGKIVSLRIFAVQCLQEFHLFAGFNPFRNDIKTETFGERHDGLHDLDTVSTIGHRTGEGTVNLYVPKSSMARQIPCALISFNMAMVVFGSVMTVLSVSSSWRV